MIDWTSLDVATDRAEDAWLRAHVADLVFTARLQNDSRRLVLVAEHKSWFDADVQEQLLRYCVHLRRAAQRRGEAAPFVAAFVLHHGTRGLSGDADESDVIAATFAPLQPSLTYVVDDLSRRSESELRRQDYPPLLQLLLLCLAFARRLDRDGLIAALHRWNDLLAAIHDDAELPNPNDALAAIAWYLYEVTDLTHEDLTMALSKHVREPGEPILYKSDRLRMEGQLAVLLRQLTRRFGPLPADVQTRLRNGSPSDIDGWSDRVLEARTLTEVLGD